MLAWVEPPSKIRPLAVATLGDIETCIEHPVREAFRHRDLGWNDHVAVLVEKFDVGFKTEFGDLGPNAITAGTVPRLLLRP